MTRIPATDRGARRANSFFALVPPDPVRDTIAGFQARLTPRLPDAVRPVAPGNFHLTLAFLGAVARDRLPALAEIARSCPMATCRLRLDRFGVFPGARVGWLGVSVLDPALAGFQERLVAALRGAGFDPDPRPWAPHLTLYRKLRTTPDTVSVDIADWVVEDYVLLHTRSTKTGPVYRQEGAWKARREGV